MTCARCLRRRGTSLCFDVSTSKSRNNECMYVAVFFLEDLSGRDILRRNRACATEYTVKTGTCDRRRHYRTRTITVLGSSQSNSACPRPCRRLLASALYENANHSDACIVPWSYAHASICPCVYRNCISTKSLSVCHLIEITDSPSLSSDAGSQSWCHQP